MALRFAMVTLHTPNYQALADITWDKNKKLYCQKHGYDAIAITDNFRSPPQELGYERTDRVIELLESGKYDWVHAVGCDTMVTNFNITYDSIVDDCSHFIIAMDCYAINNDSFLARATPECIDWLKTVSKPDVRKFYSDYVNPQGHRWGDQQAMIDHLHLLGDKLKIVPQKVLNSYDYYQYPGSIPHVYGKDANGNDGQWSRGDFLIQWPAVPMNRRLILAQTMLGQVIQ